MIGLIYCVANFYVPVISVLLYIDPGTGSLLFQILSAIALAILFYFSLLKKAVIKLFNKVTGLFTGKKESGNDS